MWRQDQPLRVILIGTDFEVRVWETLLKIPMGRAVCYFGHRQQDQKSKGLTRSWVLRSERNPLSFVVPCHRALANSARATDRLALAAVTRYSRRCWSWAKPGRSGFTERNSVIRRGPKDQTSMCNCTFGNLEIAGSMLRIAHGMTVQDTTRQVEFRRHGRVALSR